MPRIAFLSTAELCAGTHPDPAENREHRLQVEALAGACAERDLELVPVPWDDPGFEPASVAAIVLGTAWDYAARADLFLDRLQSFAESTRLFNPLPLVRWNLEKTYLRELEQRGARIVPTRWCERADPAAIGAQLRYQGVGAGRCRHGSIPAVLNIESQIGSKRNVGTNSNLDFDFSFIGSAFNRICKCSKNSG